MPNKVSKPLLESAINVESSINVKLENSNVSLSKVRGYTEDSVKESYVYGEEAIALSSVSKGSR